MHSRSLVFYPLAHLFGVTSLYIVFNLCYGVTQFAFKRGEWVQVIREQSGTNYLKQFVGA